MEEFYAPHFEENKEVSMKDKVDASYELAKAFKEMDEREKQKLIKKLNIPRKAKVSRSRMKKGYIGVLFLNDNRVIRGEKVQLDGGTYRTKDKNCHVTDGSELIFWEGKYPLVFQRNDKLNPTNLFKEATENEMYGQEKVYLRMTKDAQKDKKKGKTNWIYLILILVGGYFLIKTFFPSLFGGG